MPQADHVLVADFLEQQRRDGVQAVEPPARLVDGFADIVCRELVFEYLLVVVRISPLRDGHRAAVKPHVDQFWHAAHRSGAALSTGPGDFIDVRTMQIKGFLILARFFGEFFHAADTFAMAAVRIVAGPHGQRRSPVALTPQCPVTVICQPGAKAPVFDVLWNPVDRAIQLQQLIAVLRRADVPRLAGIVQQRRFAAPAVRVAMANRLGA